MAVSITPQPTVGHQGADPIKWDTSYEWKAVLLLSLGFALVGLDRHLIVPMFPVIMKDLGIGYQELGLISGALSIAWGISGFFIGKLSDRIGRRRVVVASMVVFSLLVGISGLANSLLTLVLLRAVMGVADGAFTPPSVIATIEASKPSRHGMNLGIQQAMMPLIGLGFAPILVTQLLPYVDWRWIFAVLTPPGLIVAFLLWKVLRDPKPEEEALHTITHDISAHKWTDVFNYRNVPLNILSMLCWLTAIIVIVTLLPSYLADYRHFGVEQMGYVLSAIGLGATIGTAFIPALSDRIGRKPVMIIATFGAFASLAAFPSVGDNVVQLFGLMFVCNMFIFAGITLTIGPLSAEAVPATLMATASGVAIGVGEVFGGGIAPILAGYVAAKFGIHYIPYFAALAMLVGMFAAFFLQETAPRIVERRAAKA